MATYQITCVTREHNSGTIIGIGSGHKRWTKASAIREIQSGATSFYTTAGGVKAAIVVQGSPPNEYLRTDPDLTTKNNLENLPTCT